MWQQAYPQKASESLGDALSDNANHMCSEAGKQCRLEKSFSPTIAGSAFRSMKASWFLAKQQKLVSGFCTPKGESMLTQTTYGERKCHMNFGTGIDGGPLSESKLLLGQLMDGEKHLEAPHPKC